jgi:hypothetical protein
MPAKKVLVIGAQGVLGAGLVDRFSHAGWQVLRGGRRPEKSPEFRLLDLDDPLATSRLCKEVDVVVNTAPHPGMAAHRAVLRDGGLLIDVTELPGASRAQLLHREPAAKGLIVADTGLGSIAYLTIAALLQKHPEARASEYALMFSAAGSTGRAAAIFAHHLLTDSRHHATIKLDLPKPWGRQRFMEVSADREGGLRDEIGGRPVRHYLGMRPRPLQSLLSALNSARVISWLPEATFTAGAADASKKLTSEPICEWVAVVDHDGRRLAERTVQGEGYYRMTIAATVAVAQTLLASNGRKPGVCSVEEAIDFDALAPFLAEGDVRIEEQHLDG